MLRATSSGVHRGLSDDGAPDDGAPLLGEGRRRGLYLGFCWATLGGRETGRQDLMGSPILPPTPWPESPSSPHPESEEHRPSRPGQSRGSMGRVLPSEPPKTRQPHQPPGLYLQGGRQAPLPTLEGGPGRAGSASGRWRLGGRRRGPRRRGSA